MSDAWTTVTEDDVLDAMNDAEANAFRTSLLADDQDDPLPGLIAKAVSRIRGSVRSCKDNKMDSDPAKIPQSLVDAATVMIRFSLYGRYPIDMPESLVKEWAENNRFLRDVQNCHFAIEGPGNETGAAAPSPGPSLSTPNLKFDRDSQSGL